MSDTKYLYLICSPNKWYGEGDEDNYKVNDILSTLEKENWRIGKLKNIYIGMKGIIKLSQDIRTKSLLKKHNIKKLESGIFATFEVTDIDEEDGRIDISIINNFYKENRFISKEDSENILTKQKFDSQSQGYITQEEFDLITNYTNQDKSHSKYQAEDKKPLKEEISKVYPRNEQYKQEALKLANFKCELDSNHKTFKSQHNTKNYVEGHHLIPMSEYDNFKRSIDVVANIVSLCPNCHRMLHFGIKNERNKALEFLFSNRKDALISSELFIELEGLKRIYEGDT